MDEQQFLKNLAEILDTEPGTLSLDERLAELSAWDSLAVVSFLAMADTNYGVKVPAAKLKDCRTIADLMRLVEKP